MVVFVHLKLSGSQVLNRPFCVRLEAVLSRGFCQGFFGLLVSLCIHLCNLINHHLEPLQKLEVEYLQFNEFAEL